MGRLSDIYGRKPLLILSQLSTLVSFLLLAMATTVPMLFLSRIIDGLLGSNFSIAQAYLSDISSKSERSKALAVSGIAFGIGFMIGPGIGGVLSEFGTAVPALLAAGITLISVLMTMYLLPETVRRRDGEETPMAPTISLRRLINFKQPLAVSMLVLLVYNLSHVTLVSSYALFVHMRYAIGALGIGLLLTLIGSVAVLVRTVLMPIATKMVGERKLPLFSMVLIIGSLSISLVIPTVWVFVIMMIVYAIGSNLARPVLTAQVSVQVPQQSQGQIMGWVGSSSSIAQIIGPIVGGVALTYASAHEFLMVAIVIVLMAAGLQVIFDLAFPDLVS